MEFFSLRNNDKNIGLNYKDSLNIKELISKLDILFEEQLSKAFKDILIIPRNNFLNIIISEVKNFLDEQYGEEIYKNEKFINFFSSSCNNLEDKYNTYFNELTKAWNEYSSKNQLNNDSSFFFTNFRKHCIDTGKLAIHHCSEEKNGFFIQVIKSSKKGTINSKKKNLQNSQMQYLICNKCRTVYFSNKFMNYCKECNINYLCSSLNYNEDPDLLLASLKKPHCDALVNEKIKCNKCKDNCLYLNMKSNRLQCHNKSCNYNEAPYNIEWICNMCNKKFHSDVKVYNPVEIQQIKDIIKLTLLLKKKAHPTKVTCCKEINVFKEDFFHKKECNGLLFFGEFNSKTIIVCDKCKAINFLVKFIWTCPVCGTRFKDKGIKNEEKAKKLLSPMHESKRNSIHKNNKLYESNNKNENNNMFIKHNNIGNISNNSSRKSKETLSSLLKRKSAKNIIEPINKDYYNNSENNPNLNNSMNNQSKNEINNHNDKTNLLIIKEGTKNQKIIMRNRNDIEKSLTESMINKTYKKKNSILDKQLISGNIEPIREETETKFNSLKISNPIVLNSNKDKNLKEPLTVENNWKMDNIRNSNKNNEIKSRLSPKNNNSFFNNYIRYVNINSNHKNKKGNKIYISYSKNQEDDINDKENEKDNNNIEDNGEKSSKKNIVGNRKYRTRRKIITEKEMIKSNNDENNNKFGLMKDKLKNGDLVIDNNYISNLVSEELYNYNNIKNIRINIDKTNKNEPIPTSVNFTKYRTCKGALSQDNISDTNSSKEENNQKITNKNKTRNIENYKKDKNISRCETLKHSFKKEDALFNLIKNKKNIEEIENNEIISKIRHRSKYKNKTTDKEIQKEFIDLNKSKEKTNLEILNKNENIQININQISKRGLFKERIKNIKENILEGQNMKEKKTVRSRKETLKIRERQKHIQNMENEKEQERIENLNLNLNEKKENNRYNQNIVKSRLDSYKIKEKTINRYSKDTEISLDKNKIFQNRFSGEHYNINRYRESYNKYNNPQKKENNNHKLNDEYNTEIQKNFHTKKTRKDYINEKIIKNEENIKKDNMNKENKTEKKSYKSNIVISSYNGSLRNKRKKSNNEIEINLDDEEDIPIFDKEIRKDKEKYEKLQRQLKLILVKSCLPKFNIDYYVIKNQIGTGSFGVIFQVYNIKTRCKFALKKIIAPDLSTLQKFEKEFELVHQNPHPNILDLIGICIQCVDMTNFIFYVLMDLAEEDWDTAINNRNKIRKYYSEFELISILKQLTSALYFLQKEKKIAHRDIKPENILIFKNEIYKIGDFGEAKESKAPKQLSTLRGTELYMSPLLYNGLHDNKDDVRHNPFKSDVFSLGYCFIYAASLNLNIIYKIRDVNSIIILKQILIKEFNRRYSEKFIDLILKMIIFNEDKRVDFIELEKILREEF